MQVRLDASVLTYNWTSRLIDGHGTGYKHAFSSEKVPMRTNLLCQFPSDEEITFELKAAEKYATSLAAFVGMHDNPVVDDSEPHSNLTSCDGTYF